MNFTFMAGLTAGNCKPSLWARISVGKINFSVLLPHETHSPVVEIDLWGKRSGNSGGGQLCDFSSQNVPFKVEIKRLVWILHLFTDYPLAISSGNIQSLMFNVWSRKNIINHLSLLCHFDDEATRAGKGEVTSPRSRGAGLLAL